MIPADALLRALSDGKVDFVLVGGVAATIEKGLNFTLTTNLGDIDLLGEIVGGGRFENLLPDTIPVTLFGLEFRCLSLPRLIDVKRAAGRPKDLEALAELEAILEERKKD